ncbi:MAG: ABC transporter ATP-binding protein [Planctomycetota bacterium]|jgi:branched-chain amino acid transport system ATP-binding protein|nr:ABC transporter ATP-binding protein [Planctomycetota bacterium]
MSAPVASFDNVSMHFGGLKAIDGLSFSVAKGKIVGIIGPNGAGKTTVFNVLSGVYTPTAGEIRFNGQLINALRPHVITGRGVARTFQNIRLFERQSVLDNLRAACCAHIKYGILDVMLSTGRMHREEREIETGCMDILSFLGLADKAGVKAGALSYGDQRRVEIARALACKPELLLLDEPAAGMNPAEMDLLNELIVRVRDHYTLTILLVEHQMRLVMGICDEILAINFGRKMAMGVPAEIRSNEQVLEAYLGKKVR